MSIISTLFNRVLCLATLFTIASFALSAAAAPARLGIAINEVTRECGQYWAGDERAGYRLPAGWKDYYAEDQRLPGTCKLASDNDPNCPKFGVPMYKCASQEHGQCFTSMDDCVNDATCALSRIVTPVGVCTYAINQEKNCCTQLGLTLVSNTLIGTRYAIHPWTGNSRTSVLPYVAGLIGIVTICIVAAMLYQRRGKFNKK